MENETNQKNKGQVILIVILFLIIIGLSGYIVYNKGFKESNEQKQEENKPINQIEEQDFDKEEAKKIISKYYKDGIVNNLNIGSDEWDQIYDMENNLFSILNLHISKKDWKNISCDKVAKKGNNNYKDRYMIDGYECTGKSIDYDFLNKIYKDLYGSNKELPKKSSKIDIVEEEGVGSIPAYLAYNKENNVFVLGEFLGDANGPFLNHYYSMIKSAKIKENKLLISLAYISLLDYDFESSPIYQIGKEKIEPNDDKINGLTTDEIIEKYLDQLDTFEFVFVKDGNHYVLESAK